MRFLLSSLLLLTAGGLAAAEGAAPPAGEAPKPAAAKAAVTLADLPEAVRAAALKQSDGAAIEKIKVDTRGSEQIYSVRWTKDNVRSEARLAADGRLLKLKAERKGKDGSVSLDHLPEAVRAAVAARVGDGKVAEVEQEDEKGAMVYSVEIVRAADRLELELSADGTIIEEKVETEEAKPKKDAKPAGDEAPKQAF